MMGTRRMLFQEVAPTPETHPDCDYVVGPFATQDAAIEHGKTVINKTGHVRSIPWTSRSMKEYAHLRAVYGTLTTLREKAQQSSNYIVSVDATIIASMCNSLDRVIRANPAQMVDGCTHGSNSDDCPDCRH